jgi:predicted ATPase
MKRQSQMDRRLGVIGLTLRNFRAFRDSGEFNLAPLTCLVGTNSSGKSSIITALLLLKQSSEQERISSRVTPLMLSGPYCDLGGFRDVVFAHKSRSEISFVFKVPMAMLQEDDREIFPRGPIVNLDVPRSHLHNPRYLPNYYMGSKKDLPVTHSVTVELSFVTDAPFGPSLSKLKLDVEGTGSANFLRTTGHERRQHWRTYTHDLPSKSVFMRNGRNRFFPIIDRRSDAYNRCPSRTKQRINKFLSATGLTLQYLQQLLTSSEMIGPFRTPPERRYAFGGFTSNRSGSSGEQAVDLLITEKLLKTSRHPLQSAVSFWLQHLKLADDVSVADLAKNINLFQLNLEGVGRSPIENVADVGYGISQVLPVIVQGLLTRPGGVYMVQQPELHLHPDAQAGLADFFLYLSLYGIRVVVETHSEYLLIRLRRRLAEGKLNIGRPLPGSTQTSLPLSKDKVAILQTENKGQQIGSKVTELVLGDSFQFENLPKGFMSQAIEDRMALLKAVGNK